MKTCPYCAEDDLKDAALVCKHCQRELPRPYVVPRPRTTTWGEILIVVSIFTVPIALATLTRCAGQRPLATQQSGK